MSCVAGMMESKPRMPNGRREVYEARRSAIGDYLRKYEGAM